MYTLEKKQNTDLLEKIQIEANLGGTTNRLGIIHWQGTGDVYKVCTLCDAIEKELGKTPVLLLIYQSFISILELFKFNKINYHILPSEEHFIIRKFDQDLLDKYGIFNLIARYDHYFTNKTKDILWAHNFRGLIGLPYVEDPMPTFIRPDKTTIDSNYLMEKYNVIPQKTYLLCPEANSEGTLDVDFWNLLAGLISLLGYKVLFNISKKENAHLYSADIVRVPYNELIEFVNLCGHVITHRSGFCEIISSTTAEMIILSSSARKATQNVSGMWTYYNPNGNIKTLAFDLLSENNPEVPILNTFKKMIRNTRDNENKIIQNLVKNIQYNVPKAESVYVPKTLKNNATGYKYIWSMQYEKNNDVLKNFSQIEYSAFIENGTIDIEILPPLGDFLKNNTLHMQLICDGKVIVDLKYYPLLHARFTLDEFGVYVISIDILNNKTKEKMNFNTETFPYNEGDLHLTINPNRSDYKETCDKIKSIRDKNHREDWRRDEIICALQDYSEVYSIKKYLADNKLERVFFYGELKDKLLLREVSRHFATDPKFQKRFISDRVFKLEDKMVGHASTVFNPIHLRELQDGDTIILILPEKATKETIARFDKFNVQIVELLNIVEVMQWNSLLWNPLLNFAKDNPELPIHLIPDFKNPKYNPNELGRITLNNVYHHRVMRNGAYGDKKIIPPALSQYDIEEVKEMVKIPADYWDNDICKLSNAYGGLVNVRNGVRKTSNQPEDYEKTVYLFGHESIFGIGSPDDKTIASYLQQLYNEHDYTNIKVENYSNFSGLQYYKMFSLLESIEYKPDDIVVVMHNFFPGSTEESIGNIHCYSRNGIFSPIDDDSLYIDHYHVNEQGNEIIAKKLFEQLTK